MFQNISLNLHVRSVNQGLNVYFIFDAKKNEVWPGHRRYSVIWCCNTYKHAEQQLPSNACIYFGTWPETRVTYLLLKRYWTGSYNYWIGLIVITIIQMTLRAPNYRCTYICIKKGLHVSTVWMDLKGKICTHFQLFANRLFKVNKIKFFLQIW